MVIILLNSQIHRRHSVGKCIIESDTIRMVYLWAYYSSIDRFTEGILLLSALFSQIQLELHIYMVIILFNRQIHRRHSVAKCII